MFFYLHWTESRRDEDPVQERVLVIFPEVFPVEKR